MQKITLQQAMLDDDFSKILSADPVLEALEKQKWNAKDEFFELMMILSKVFRIGGMSVSCITPAVWAFLFATGNGYATNENISEADTDIFLYILHNGIKNIDEDFLEKANGFCKAHGLNYIEAELDLKNLIYLSFRPLEMLNGLTASNEASRFNADWLTKIVSIVCPLTGKTSDEVIYDMSLTECFYYYIQKARESDVQGMIKRRNSGQINEAIYQRTIELGQQYYQQNYQK